MSASTSRASRRAGRKSGTAGPSSWPVARPASRSKCSSRPSRRAPGRTSPRRLGGPRGTGAGGESEGPGAAERAVAWEYLTAPARRALWQGDGLEIEEVAPAGRRGVDTTRFCVDGRTTVYEEILDWRPFHYFTEGKTLPGPVRLVLTTELEPAAEGTLARVGAARPEGG